MNSVQSLFLVLPLVLFASVQCGKMCNLSDYVCMTKGNQRIFEAVEKEIDPLHIDEITGATANMKYKITNVTLSGLKNCKVIFATANKAESTYEIHLSCPKLIQTYFYEVNGKVNDFEIEGKSNGLLTATDYVIINHGKYGIKNSEADKIPHFYTESFYLDTHPGIMKFESGKLLTKKGVDISPQLTTLVNENWRAYERYWREQLMTKFMEFVVSAFGKKLSSLTLSESFPGES